MLNLETLNSETIWKIEFVSEILKKHVEEKNILVCQIFCFWFQEHGIVSYSSPTDQDKNKNHTKYKQCCWLKFMRACDSEMIRVGTSSRAAQKRVLQPPNQSPIRRIRCRFVFLQLKTVIPTPRKSMLMGDVVRATLLIFTSRFPVTKWDWWYPVSIPLRDSMCGTELLQKWSL